AFRATLEEVIEADLILHVRDIADPDTRAQADDVYAILAQLGIGESGHERVLEVWNKTDLLPPDALDAMREVKQSATAPVLVSALTGEGVEHLLREIATRTGADENPLVITIAPADLGRLSWIYQNSQVITREDLEDGAVRLTLRAAGAIRNKLEAIGRS
ncbi:MAG: GTPase HflX, partial [Nitratireductor sp.]|nr:GTPase HflX [Nitratireductor sp.]